MTRDREPLPTRVRDLPRLPAAYDERLSAGIATLGIDLTPEARVAIDDHLRLLLAWTAAINLTSIRDPVAAATRHVLDSLAAVALLRDLDVGRLLDLGSGGGYPGIPLAAAIPADALLVESIVKKARFLEVAVAATGLAGRVGVAAVRAEALARDPTGRERWPIVTVAGGRGPRSSRRARIPAPRAWRQPHRLETRRHHRRAGARRRRRGAARWRAADGPSDDPPRPARARHRPGRADRATPRRRAGPPATRRARPPTGLTTGPATLPRRMRVAVLSDIHANLVALDAVLASLGSVDAIWHLGDVVGYGPEPDGVVGRLAERGARGVRGNHDAATVGALELDWFNPDARAAVEWTRRRITPTTRAWLADLPAERTEDGFALVHGSVRDPMWEYVTQAPVARASLAILADRGLRFGLFGHTHLPTVFLDDDGRIETIRPGDGSTLRLDEPSGAPQPGQRRSASRWSARGGLPGPRHRGFERDLASGPLRHRGGPGGHARRPAAGAAGGATRVRPVAMAIGGRRPLQGRKLADRRVRVERQTNPYFRWSGPGQLTAKAAASAPTTPFGRFYVGAKRVLIGRPLASEEEIGERLPKTKALAIFSSDAISSSTYASEEILIILVAAGTAGIAFSIPIAIGIAGLLLVVSTSYRQICYAYPSGGGAYAVAKANINMPSALLAAAALLFDYMMTVAVSIAAGVAAITSVFPGLLAFRVELCVIAIGLLTVANLRGLRESGNIFAVPTYVFVAGALVMIGLGLAAILSGNPAASFPTPDIPTPPGGFEAISIFLVVRAFAFGSVALTGTEAISNGVPAFKPPEPRNAANTLTIMAVLLGIIFVGISLLAAAYGIVPSATETLISQVGRTVFGIGPVYYVFQAATALILLLAANTGYNGAPRLAQILAADGYLPRQFSFRGDRLAYSYGIIILAAISTFFVVVFDGSVTALIPLYSVGIFASFTLSQAGMVKHWLGERVAGWRWKLGVNLVGATITGHRVGHHRRSQGRQGRLDRPHRGPAHHPGHDVHPPPVRRAGRGAGGPRRHPHRPAPSRATGRHPRPWREPCRRPGGELRAIDRDRRTGGVRDGRPGARARHSDGAGSASSRTCRSSSSSRRIVPWSGRW